MVLASLYNSRKQGWHFTRRPTPTAGCVVGINISQYMMRPTKHPFVLPTSRSHTNSGHCKSHRKTPSTWILGLKKSFIKKESMI